MIETALESLDIVVDASTVGSDTSSVASSSVVHGVDTGQSTSGAVGQAGTDSSRSKSTSGRGVGANASGRSGVRVTKVSFTKLSDLAGEFSHCDRSVVNNAVNHWSFYVDLVDLLGGMVVLYSLSLSLDDGLDLLDDVLVDVLSDDGGIDGGRVGLLANSLLVLVLGLAAVLLGVVLGDVFLNMTGYMRSNVLVVGVELLLIDNRLNLLVDLGLLSLSVHDGSNLVVSVLDNVLVNNGIEYVSGMCSSDLVIDNVLGGLSKSQSSGSVVFSAGILIMNSLSSFLLSESSHNFVDDAHGCWLY